jgi:hypothetical protein
MYVCHSTSWQREFQNAMEAAGLPDQGCDPDAGQYVTQYATAPLYFDHNFHRSLLTLRFAFRESKYRLP